MDRDAKPKHGCCAGDSDAPTDPAAETVVETPSPDRAGQEPVLKRLARIEGQVKGIRRMVEEGRYCIDVVNQISAARAALGGVIDVVLKNHLETCVTNAMTGNDPADRQEKIKELLSLYARARSH